MNELMAHSCHMMSHTGGFNILSTSARKSLARTLRPVCFNAPCGVDPRSPDPAIPDPSTTRYYVSGVGNRPRKDSVSESHLATRTICLPISDTECQTAFLCPGKQGIVVDRSGFGTCWAWVIKKGQEASTFLESEIRKGKQTCPAQVNFAIKF